jgi:hypothetical protein
VVLVESDRKVTDPDSPEAVQVPVALNQEENEREVNAQPSSNEASESEPAAMYNPNLEERPAPEESSESEPSEDE